MQTSSTHRHAMPAAISLAIALSLSACGGGAGNTRPTPPPVAPTDPCVTNPNAPQCQPAPPAPPPAAAPSDDYLGLIHAKDAHALGFTGKGVKVAVMDSGIDASLPDFAGRNLTFYNFANGSTVPTDGYGHGSVITGLLAGSATGEFAGGISPDVNLYVGKICDDTGFCTISATRNGNVATTQANYFYDQGVRLFNYSLGNSTTTGGLGLDPSYFSDLSVAYQSMIEGGALFIWAAGNKGAGTLSREAAAPHYFPGLAGGWVVAVNVAADDAGKITGLYSGKDAAGNATGSSDCGIAADWCLAAPGYAYTLGPDGTIFKDGHTSGTSNSAAIVTGAAALVSQAYPWMTGHNIQQTLLTTATHLQDTDDGVSASYQAGTAYTPNSVYGWGLVDAGRAVRGPGQLVGAFDANVGDYASTFSNVIAGSGSLVVGGATGSLELSADNTYSGGTTINGATLVVSGSVASGVTLNGGTLTGFGAVHADVNNITGMVATLNTTPDKGLTIDGNYTVGANGTTSIALGHVLTVGKTAKLDGALILTAPEDAYTPKSTETLIAAGAVDGAFAATDDSKLVYYTAKVNYGATSVTADLTRVNVVHATSMSSPVLANMAQGLEGALKQADGWSQGDYASHKTFLDTAAQFLSASSQAQADASVVSLSGEIHGTVNAIEAVNAGQIDHAVALRQQVATQGAHVSAWVQGLSSDGGLSQSGFASARFRVNGSLLGLDIPVTDNFMGGVLAGKTRATGNLDALAGRVTERDTFAGLYGIYRFDEGAYVAGRATWSHAKLNTVRTALIGDSAYTLGADRTDGVGRVAIEAGKRFGAFTPYVGVSSLRINQSAFAEGGAGGFGLAASSQRHSVTLMDLGARWDKAFAWGGTTATLTGYAAYKHVLHGADLSFTGALVGAPDAPFSIIGQSLPRHAAEAGVTLDASVGEQWGWYFNLNGQAAPNRYHAFGANAGVRFTF